MISRSAAVKSKIVREVPTLRSREPAKQGALDKVWDQVELGKGSITSKIELLEAMKKANVKFIPEVVTEPMAVAAFMHGKKIGENSTVQEFVVRHGVSYYSWLIDLWKGKIEAALNHIRKNAD